MSRTRISFLEGLPTITSIVEGFGGVPSAETDELLVATLLRAHSTKLYHQLLHPPSFEEFKTKALIHHVQD